MFSGFRPRRAEIGEIATAGEIKVAFEAHIGPQGEEISIYRLLKRHGWRKLVPRPRAAKDTRPAFMPLSTPLRHAD